MKTWGQAMEAGDGTMIGHFLADSFLGVGPLGQAENKMAFLRRAGNPALKVTALVSGEQSISIQGPVLIVSGIHEIRGTLDGRDIGGRYRYVDVLRKIDERWMVVASTLTRVIDPLTAPEQK